MFSNQTDRQKVLDALLGRALRDKAFRDKLVSNPAEAAKDAGLTAEELKIAAGGLAIGSSLNSPRRAMYCTERTCNEGCYQKVRP